jgi:hypothetical protein
MMVKGRQLVFLLSVVVILLFAASAEAQEEVSPYFVTYDHILEKRDTLELSLNATHGRADGINPFTGFWMEAEYGVRQWWTSELYLDWQHTKHEGTPFTGFRLENRFRPFREEHLINPVLYVEYENISDADKTIKEVVGFDNKEDLAVPNSETEMVWNHELDTKLILSSQAKGFNFAGNFIAEKNLQSGPWELGYALGLSRPLTSSGKLVAALEMYGGLGVVDKVTVHNTSQYLAPVLAWTLGETTFRISPGWGLTDDSIHTILRFGVSHEVDDFFQSLRRMIH